ncbi:hypothetical protein CA85_07580 [Allorhodopirellula solitaria]|uniref:Uncharacterized protein n=1 Tax=Allorhodopirellula solitaria TaxID=2527987 RepID=A0A5C5YDR7_9BACT|nr:hypothetical protein CA85_07580 [Allorhodopirellula solitaria]
MLDREAINVESIVVENGFAHGCSPIRVGGGWIQEASKILRSDLVQRIDLADVGSNRCGDDFEFDGLFVDEFAVEGEPHGRF